MNDLLATIVLTLFILLVIIFILSRKKKADFESADIKKKWQEVEELVSKNSEVYWKMAVIEADKLMDLALKRAEMHGSDMGQRIRYATSRNHKMRKIWEPHILRNNLVHDAHHQVGKQEARKAVADFKDGLKMMGVL